MTLVKEDILKQHKQILLTAGVELATNNTNSLIEDDIINGIIEVPLETMDILRQRIVNIAKNNNLILNSDEFNIILRDYKDKVKEEFRNIFLKRIKLIENNYSLFDDNSPLNLVKSLKKDLIKFNKEIRKEYKVVMLNLIKDNLVNKLDLFVNNSNSNFKKDATKFLQSIYIKQVLEMIDMKVVVKDTILINSLKEQLERFIFTKENSHLFD